MEHLIPSKIWIHCVSPQVTDLKEDQAHRAFIEGFDLLQWIRENGLAIQAASGRMDRMEVERGGHQLVVCFVIDVAQFS